ncbi:uncharacterized protein N7515_001263 [Penicillium bovifimosum]|uniref:Uncharacterized protein n=1 Tax=Penicillium bovifimosum TaxID=126998 RepID=A0A9W9HB57_9EURO|nr:uncharacterized protein N7515_001263 [Penicillium bovifimosum]KAJ5142476.1 hypothetical protein N7515_001263 [Penicillium bovifimosum]
MTLTSNEKRAQRRQECREALVAHIHERLGLKVPPNRVRLQPRSEDGYAWSVAEGYEYLLATSLSNGSVGRYGSIIDNLGRSIEAIHPKTLVPSCTNQNSNPSTTSPIPQVENGSFTATIRRLECENEELTDELDQAQSRSNALLMKVEEWKTRAQAMEEQLRESQSLVARLDEELREAQGGMAKAVKLLQSFRAHEEPQSRGSENPICYDAARSPSREK